MTMYKVADLEGALLDCAVAKVLGHSFKLVEGLCVVQTIFLGEGEEPLRIADEGSGKGLIYQPTAKWGLAGELLQKFGCSLSPPESRVHRNGGNHPGWGESGLWGGTIFRRAGRVHERVGMYHESEPMTVICRLVVQWHVGEEVELP